MKKVLSILICALCLSSCGTLFTPTKQAITFMGMPGTRIYDNGKKLGEIEEDGEKKPVFTDIKEIEINGTKPTYRCASVYDEPYKNVGDNEIVLVKETGELLLGKNVYDKLMELSDVPTTSYNEAEIRVTYEKSKWENNDLRPEHYFACKLRKKEMI